MSNHKNETIIFVHDNDVLSGRGINISDHPGNQRFRVLIANQTDTSSFTSCPTVGKRTVANEIVKQVKRWNPPGRFLKREGKKQVRRGLVGPWIELSGEEVIKKICQALHDCNRLDRHGYANGVKIVNGAKQLTSESNEKSFVEGQSAVRTIQAIHANMDEQDLGAEKSFHEGKKTFKRKRAKNFDTPEMSHFKKNKIIIHKSTRYKKHEANVTYLECCKNSAASCSENVVITVLAKQVIFSMEKKGLSFWIDEDNENLRKMTPEEQLKTVKKKLANDRFSSSLRHKNEAEVKVLQRCNKVKTKISVAQKALKRKLMEEREETALNAMISLGRSPCSERTVVQACKYGKNDAHVSNYAFYQQPACYPHCCFSSYSQILPLSTVVAHIDQANTNVFPLDAENRLLSDAAVSSETSSPTSVVRECLPHPCSASDMAPSLARDATPHDLTPLGLKPMKKRRVTLGPRSSKGMS